MMDDLSKLARDLSQAADVGRAARAVTGQAADAVRDTAREMALSTWTKYGRGLAGSAGTIDAVMAPPPLVAANVRVSGVGGIMQERGTSRHPPQPVLEPAMERHEKSWVDTLADIGVRGIAR